ncbi:MAG: tripartite tricarboxylate transporter TctB family protein [Burkholderiaceae bacterium]
MKLNDAVFGLLLLALAASVLLFVQSFPKIPGQQVGPALFPGLIAIGLGISGAVLTVRGWRARASIPMFRAESWTRSPRHFLALVMLIGAVVFYIVAADALGFLLTVVLILTALLWVLGTSPMRSLVIAVIATVTIHFAFYKLLRVPLPWGVLTPYAW